MSQFESGSTKCQFCDYEEKDFNTLSNQEIEELMAPYEYEVIENGVRIIAVKNERSMRGAIGIPHFVTEIASGAFSHCKFLARVELPKNLRSIEDWAFANCRDLFDVFIPESVSFIGKGAFSDCYDLSVICAQSPSQPKGWNEEWLLGCNAKIEWESSDKE
jgi:hypothetical protein